MSRDASFPRETAAAAGTWSTSFSWIVRDDSYAMMISGVYTRR